MHFSDSTGEQENISGRLTAFEDEFLGLVPAVAVSAVTAFRTNGATIGHNGITLLTAFAVFVLWRAVEFTDPAFAAVFDFRDRFKLFAVDTQRELAPPRNIS
jgi:hypothetical protein